uniref:U14-Liphistoxin-Lm1a_1 n=1 Tax=Liphistius malayanus TaxID=1203467 RepID=A0A482ZAI5_9ARAC
MKYIIIAIVCFLLLVEVMEIHAAGSSVGFEGISESGNILGNGLLRKKRSCIRRGGICDGRPSYCCPNSSCRCSLWGTNCRCERAGLSG